MWLWIVLLFVGILALFAIGVLNSYAITKKIYRRYKAVSCMVFFPLTGYMNKLEESFNKYGDSIELFLREKQPGQKFLVTNLGLAPYIIFYDW
jgi:hypothetical protein